MDRLLAMRVFVAVAEKGGFALAARHLNMSPSMATRAIANLEERLGVKLFHRTTRYVRTTDAGERYLEEVKAILDSVEQAEASARGSNAEPRGKLTVTAPALFGRMHVMPVIVDYLRLYPETQVSAMLLDRVVNLVEEGVDVGVRIGKLPDSTLYALPVGNVHHVVCAAPAYLDAHNEPQCPQDLARHVLIGSSAGNYGPGWQFAGDSRATRARLRPRLTVSTNDAAIEAAVRGFGITRLLSYQVAPFVANGELKVLLTDYQPRDVPVHVIHRESRLGAFTTRRFIDSLVERLRADLQAHRL